MIPAFAVKKYLNKKCDDHTWVKDLSSIDFSTLEERTNINQQLRLHQRACFMLGMAYPQFAFYLDMGLGKSILVLELLKHWRALGKLRKALIFVTSDKAFPTWEAQIAKFNVDVPYILLEGSSDQKWGTLEKFKGGFIILTYPGALAMASVSVKKKGKSEWALDDRAVKALGTEVDAIVLDESTKCGNHNSLTYKLISRLTKQCEIRYALAGRPLGRDPTMLWAQQKLIDGGESLGETLGLFRAAFCIEEENPWHKYAKNYTFKKSMLPQLARLTRHRSITYASSECLDLPAVLPIIEEVRQPVEAAAYYDRVVQQIIEARGDLRAMKNAFLRMRQLSSGFMGFIGDQSGEKIEIEFKENPKLERLMELVEELPRGRKMTIFYDFTWSARKIMKEIRARHLDAIWLWSGTKDAKGDLHRFQTQEGCDIAVIQNRVGAYSIDGLQVANYQVFYESPVSVIDREQAERRIQRDGQKFKIFRYDLLMKDTLDRRILEFHREGDTLLEALRRDPRKQLDLISHAA